jgi:aminoglycoside 3'-phosphotransferase-2
MRSTTRAPLLRIMLENGASNDMNIPTRWCEQFAGAPLERQAIGESRADVFRIRRGNGADLFLKSEPVSRLSEIPDEVERKRSFNDAP